MNEKNTSSLSTKPAPIYIISGGMGASGEQVVRTVLAQFPEVRVPVITTPHVRNISQVEDVLSRAVASGGLVVHTLVDNHLRQDLIEIARARGIIAIDLMGDLLSNLSDILGQTPLVHPGRYRQLNEAYFRRIEAMEFAIAHDDGHRPHEWSLAEVVLTGVSRVGKTPLSMYLSMQGWKVANVPLVIELPVPPELFHLDFRQVIGLYLEPGQLLFHRQQRQRHLGISGRSAYTDPVKIYEEVEFARSQFRRGRFTEIDVTDKPIETTAEEIVALITRRFEKAESYNT